MSYERNEENYRVGLDRVDLPAEFGKREEGKVRDFWLKDGIIIFVSTDRKSAYDREIGLFPGIGKAVNEIQAFFFESTGRTLPNHFLASPHPYVTFAKSADVVLPVEFVWRTFMAKAETATSIFRNYRDGNRNIYGIDFPDGLRPNERFPMGPILTPTTKAERGEHDLMLTHEEARDLVDAKVGRGVYDQAVKLTGDMYQIASKEYGRKRIDMVDSKYEVGLYNGRVILIDEVNTPDSSRFWMAEDYQARFEAGLDQKWYDKEMLRSWLADRGFRGEGEVPTLSSYIRRNMVARYAVPYRLLTGSKLPSTKRDSGELASDIRQSIIKFANDNPLQRLALNLT